MSQKLCACQPEAKKESVVIKIKTCYGKHGAEKPEDFVTVSFKNCKETTEGVSKPEPAVILCTNRPKPNEKPSNDQDKLPESTIILYKREPEPKDEKPFDNQDKLLRSPAPREPEEVVPPEESSKIQKSPVTVVEEPGERTQIPEDPPPSEQPRTPTKPEDVPTEPEDTFKESEKKTQIPEDPPPSEQPRTPTKPEDVPREPEETKKRKSVGTKPPKKAENDEIIEKPVGHAVLPTLTPRYHGNGCVLEICLLEKHDDACPNHKQGNPQRNPLDDKTGSYEAIGRMTFRTCNAMNENAINKEVLRSKMVLYYSLIDSRPSSLSTQSETRLKNFFEKMADSKKNFELKRSFSTDCVCTGNCKNCGIQCNCKEIDDSLPETSFGRNRTVQVEPKPKKGWFQNFLSCIAQ